MWISISVVVAIFGYYFGNRNNRIDEGHRQLPPFYAYHKLDSAASIVLVTSERNCLDKIDDYYKAVEFRMDDKLPGCFEHGLEVNSVVYIIGQGLDSTSVEIAHFYKSKYGSEKKLTGYVAKRMLHEKAYLK